MLFSRNTIICSVFAACSVLFFGCKKEETIPPNQEPGVEQSNNTKDYDFKPSSDYPTARTWVKFETVNVPEGLPTTWYVDGVEHLDNNFRYSFPKAGIYTVKLVVNYDEANSVTKELYVVAGSVYAKYTGVTAVNELLFFSSERAEGGQSKWDFGDGTTSAKSNPSHSYAKAGEYTVKLEVTGLEDKPLTSTLRIKIEDDPGVTKQMEGERTWQITKQRVYMPNTFDPVQTLPNEKITMKYVNKITISVPFGQSTIGGDYVYKGDVSTPNRLVYTKHNVGPDDSLFFDPVADTMYCKSTGYPVMTPKGPNPNIQDIYIMHTP